jgi:hypothetical protein
MLGRRAGLHGGISVPPCGRNVPDAVRRLCGMLVRQR